jgi:hypothetical protein
MFPKWRLERFHKKIYHHVSNREIAKQISMKKFDPKRLHSIDLIHLNRPPTNQCRQHSFKLNRLFFYYYLS